ncbi:MAG: ribonuclease HII [Desulfomonilaceae bacterium]
MPPDDKYEQKAFSSGFKIIAGVDEAGRGPLAGPVVAAAVVLCPDKGIAGLNDSKQLSEPQREKLFSKIQANAKSIGIGIVQPDIIDTVNIYQATRLAMKNAVNDLHLIPEFLLIDGPLVIDVKMPQQQIIKGDQLSNSIAAASIVAKVTRDRIMVNLHEQFPLYEFKKNKGYGTKQHTVALLKHGPCPAHRKSFGLVKSFFGQDLFRG